jgi:ribosomal protein S18 acetylase RimI-like enzyme
MKGDIETREFLIDDYEVAVELWKRVEGVEIAEGDDREGVAQFIARNAGLSRVAIDRPKIVGIAFCGQDGRRGYIYHLAVDPNYRGRGLGKRLVDECLEGLRRLGLKRANIMVATDNPRGREFWSKCGWEELDGAIGMGIDL